MIELKSRPAVQMINLGCAKNEVDSEEMLGVLKRDGFALGSANGQVDVVVVNTCGFIESAKQESIDVILQALERKRRGDVRKVVVAGCLVQRYSGELAREMPDVDAFVGTGEMADIGRIAAESLVRPEQLLQVAEKPHHRWLDVPVRVRSNAPWTAYLKISEGCDHKCTFCAIPSFRGKHVSKPLDRVVDEARMLAGDGAVELNLIAQDSTQYGYDLYKQPMLPKLLEALSQIEGLRWIRLFYCYPSRVNERIIEAISGTDKVCQYIDMPLQHADDDVLRAMRRPLSGAAYLDILNKFRAASPDVSIRTTFIVGFPGETEAQFENLLRFVETAKFDRAGVFEYSTEDGTPSAELPDRVPARVKRSRKDRLMRLQQGISLERNRAWIGREIDVLVESISHDSDSERPVAAASKESTVRQQAAGPRIGVGRSFRDAPEIDGSVTVHGFTGGPGDFVRARVLDARHYDLIAEQAEPI